MHYMSRRYSIRPVFAGRIPLGTTPGAGAAASGSARQTIERISGIMSFGENLARVRERIAAAAERSGRSASDVTIVAVTKTFGPEAVEEAVRGGIRDIGENRVQEFLEKADRVSLDCRWHLIGHLQSNKVNKAIGRFAMIQSVDSVALAGKLGRAGKERGLTTDILVEVNTSGE
ncbi:MAG TPA: hypothetical protein ENO08_06190, partial [Candidatus Eisenbacteria bacterium]|nr:hypothetical protein [Candidatus Eisenbacteria bacterium]